MAAVVPALFSANLAFLADALGMIKAAGAAMVHVDVADGHFAPEITVGQPVIASLRKATNLALDIRLLVERPERFVGEFLEAGADRISVHPEATRQLHRVLEFIRERGAKAGVALDAVTPVDSMAEALGDLDFLTILSAGLGMDEPFIPRSVEKVGTAARMRAERHLDFAIQVEGGVGLDHFEDLIRAGADILVVGSAIFHKGDPGARLAEMIRLAAEAKQVSKV